ncbi:MAG: UPF0147 family protein [Candidatus Woesearchaeota archaeon]
MKEEKVNKIIEALEYLKEDPMTIKRVKDKAGEIIDILKEGADLTIDKVLRELEELDASEIPSYDRTLIWDIVSMLERLTH